ncbi:MAG: ribosome recycling factor [Myxococcales bacterium]
MEQVIKELKGHIERTLGDLQHELTKVRTGRANLAVVDGIKVDYYGTPTPLTGVGTLGVPDARLITITPWDKSVIPAIEKAINEAGIGLTPSNDGTVVRLPIPALTEERRREIAKQVKTKGEDHKVAIRNLRRDANEKLKAMEKDKKISADDHKRGVDRVQKETDAGIAKVDEMVARKEKEVLEV